MLYCALLEQLTANFPTCPRMKGPRNTHKPGQATLKVGLWKESLQTVITTSHNSVHGVRTCPYFVYIYWLACDGCESNRVAQDLATTLELGTCTVQRQAIAAEQIRCGELE